MRETISIFDSRRKNTLKRVIRQLKRLYVNGEFFPVENMVFGVFRNREICFKYGFGDGCIRYTISVDYGIDCGSKTLHLKETNKRLPLKLESLLELIDDIRKLEAV